MRSEAFAEGRSAFFLHSFTPRLEIFKPATETSAGDMENDFVIVLPGLIIGLECKESLDRVQMTSAVKQWANLKQVLQQDLGLSDKNFQFLKCLAYHETSDDYAGSEHCSKCSPYLLKYTGEQSFIKKLLALLENVPTIPVNELQRGAFRAAVRDLLIFTSSKADASDTELRVADAFAQTHARYINTPAKTVFFWDPDQYDILKHDIKFLVLAGGEPRM